MVHPAAEFTHVGAHELRGVDAHRRQRPVPHRHDLPPDEAPPAGAHRPAVGRPLDRVDGAAKTSGAARYAAEHPFADLAHAALVHATIPRGRITGFDTAPAEAVPGVLAVLTHRNVPRMAPPPRVSMLDLPTMGAGTSVNYHHPDAVH